MNIFCKQCGSRIPVSNLNVNQFIAKCDACHAVFSFAGLFGHHSSAPVERLPVPMPDKISIDDRGYDMTIRRRWFGFQHIFLLVFALMWNGFLVVWIGMALAAGAREFALFSVVHVLVGIGVGYSALAGFVNSTTIQVDRRDLRVKHGPLPWFNNRTLPVHTLKQLYIKERISRGRNSTSVSYILSAIMDSGKDVALVGGLYTPEQALFLEQELERFLGITDQPVRGEFGRGYGF